MWNGNLGVKTSPSLMAWSWALLLEGAYYISQSNKQCQHHLHLLHYGLGSLFVKQINSRQWMMSGSWAWA